MEFSSRIEAIAQMVQCSNMADIGTDHGYVPIWLFLNGKLQKGIACDIHKEPLAKAAENISLTDANAFIETRLGNGLSPIQKGEVDSVVIAGMGGMLIISILEAAKEVVNELKELILSPHLDVPKVRQYLHSIGFFIQKEHMLKEDGKYYTVIRAVPGEEHYDTAAEYTYGKQLLADRDIVLLEYLEEEEKRFLKLHQRLKQESSIAATQRCKEVEAEINDLQEVRKWLLNAK